MKTALIFLAQFKRTVGSSDFADFLEKPADQSDKTSLPLLMESVFANPFQIIVRSFTKVYAMAGIRLGYGITSNAALLQKLHGAADPWAVSQIAQEAGIAALKETAYKKKILELVETERPRVAAALKEMGFRVIEGDANFLMFFDGKTDRNSGKITSDFQRAVSFQETKKNKSLFERLAEQGILIRDLSGLRGLSCENGTWYRIAIRTKEENDRLIEAIRFSI